MFVCVYVRTFTIAVVTRIAYIFVPYLYAPASVYVWVLFLLLLLLLLLCSSLLLSHVCLRVAHLFIYAVVCRVLCISMARTVHVACGGGGGVVWPRWL